MRIAVYMRCSTGEQTLDSQKVEIERYLQSRQPCKVTWYADQGYGGGKTDRPAFQRMLGDIRRRRFDLLVCFKLDRLSRSLLDAVQLLDVLRCHDVKLVSLRDGISFEGVWANLLYALVSGLAEIEAEGIRARVRAGLANARKNGVVLGRPATTIDLNQVRQLLKKGQTMAAVADQFSVCLRTLQRRLNGKGK
ncbi:MAG: DNA-invertase hin [Phycisphaerae bacterium]|nr:DNA-invertase hin [Phycisphaerae bacterium]